MSADHCGVRDFAQHASTGRFDSTKADRWAIDPLFYILLGVVICGVPASQLHAGVAVAITFDEDFTSGPPGDAIQIRNLSTTGEKITDVKLLLTTSDGNVLIDPLDPSYPVFPSVDGADQVGAFAVGADAVGADPLFFSEPLVFLDPGTGILRSGYQAIEVGFSDFDAGESFQINLDADSQGGSASRVDGIDWEGTSAIVTYSTGEILAGEFVSSGASQATFLAPIVLDTDEDGLTDAQEAELGTDPNDPDTDDDGLLDGTEVEMAEGTGCPNPTLFDSDGDGLGDGAEVALGTSPCTPDTDGDGVWDNNDPTPTDPGVPANWIEAELRTLGAELDTLDLSYFSGKNDNVAAGRRNALSNRANAAANAVNAGDIESAIDQLLGVLAKLDGDPNPPDWMYESAAQEDIAAGTWLMIDLLINLSL